MVGLAASSMGWSLDVGTLFTGRKEVILADASPRIQEQGTPRRLLPATYSPFGLSTLGGKVEGEMSQNSPATAMSPNTHHFMDPGLNPIHLREVLRIDWSLWKIE